MDIDQLDVWKKWRETPFPEWDGSDLGELRPDLAYLDYLVADTVIPYVEDGKPFTPPTDVISRLSVIEKTLLTADATPEVHKLLEYVALLKEVFAIVSKTAAGD